MVERTLVDEIISIIHSEANNNPLPLKCTIHETYPNGLIDVLLENGTILTYLPVIGSPSVGDTGVLLYLDDEKNNQIIITNGGSITDTGWQNVSFSADYTNYPDDSLKIRRIGNIVEINGSWTALKNKTASSAPIPFATIDEEFRPESDVYVRQQGPGMNTYLLLVEPNGNVYWSKYGTSSSSNITASNRHICHALWTVNGGAVAGGGSTGTGGSNVDLSNYIQKSSTSGLVKNDGSIDTTSYLSSLPSHTHMKSEITDFTHTHSIDDVAGLQTTLNEKANTSHTHTTSEITDFPVIPDVSNYIQKSSITGLVKNDGSIDSNDYVTSQELPSKLSDLTNDTGFITLSALNDYVTKDNLSIKYSNEIPTEVDPSEPYSLCIVKSSNGYDVYSIQSTGWVKSATIPSDFAISSHNHNDLYYTKSEVDNMNLGGGGEVDLSNYIQKSSITGLVKNDGSIDSNDYVTSQELPSKTSDLINDSSFTTLQAVYPVGSIYMSINNTNPSVLFGFGVWEKIEDKFLLGSGTTYANGSTGGSADSVVVSHSHKPNTDGEYIVTSEDPTANNTKVAYSSNGNRWVDGQTSQSHFHHRTGTSTVGEDGTGKNMPPYLAVNIWKRTA